MEPQSGAGEQALSVEQRLQGAAEFMASNGISAMLVGGRLTDNRRYEGVRFDREAETIGEVLFAEGKLVVVDIEEHKRRLAVSGFINEVVRPLQRAVAAVYGEGSDLLDERFDVLPRLVNKQ